LNENAYRKQVYHIWARHLAFAKIAASTAYAKLVYFAVVYYNVLPFHAAVQLRNHGYLWAMSRLQPQFLEKEGQSFPNHFNSVRAQLLSIAKDYVLGSSNLQ
jgi:hypothetical protein